MDRDPGVCGLHVAVQTHQPSGTFVHVFISQTPLGSSSLTGIDQTALGPASCSPCHVFTFQPLSLERSLMMAEPFLCPPLCPDPLLPAYTGKDGIIPSLLLVGT